MAGSPVRGPVIISFYKSVDFQVRPKGKDPGKYRSCDDLMCNIPLALLSFLHAALALAKFGLLRRKGAFYATASSPSRCSNT